MNTEEEKNTNKDKTIGLIVSFIAWAIVMLIVAIKLNKIEVLLKDFTHPIFLILFFSMVAFTLYCYLSKKIILKKSAERALMAFIIAYLARVDLVFGVFFIIFIFSYYSDDNDYWV